MSAFRHSPNGKIEDLHNFFSPYSGPAWAGVAQRSPATGSCNGLHRESNFLEAQP